MKPPASPASSGRHTFEEAVVKQGRLVVSIGASALASVLVGGCGSSERVVVSAPSSVPMTAQGPGAAQLAPREGTTTPVSITALVDGTACPSLQFMVSSYTFRVSASTQYTGGTCANLHAGSRINFTGTRLSPTALVFDVATLSFATTVAPPPTPTPPPPSSTPVRAEATVTAIGAGMCPELQFFFNSYALNVSYATQYTGGTCADIRVGARVAISGVKKDTETFIRVASMTFQGNTGTSPQPPASPTNPTGRPVEGEGVISSLRSGTTCPALEFLIGEYVIALDAATLFDRGACGDLAPGVRVHVVGTMSGTAVSAARVSVQGDAPGRPVVEGEGRVSRLLPGAGCPALTFMIEEYTVAVSNSTVFVGGTCGDVVVGRQLGVQGTVTGERQVLATQIVFKGGSD
jgi:uncharacterized protein DUF5666